ncbi:cytochrome P450 [Mycolicibacterium stellerae]|uniref:cytochrome P450 n=1 Tax=Mycolicibacterium stellerae TaxID=2358193 RepID=UPI000F0B3382|nr:cytochrome P450 [Mycolicibacterium stellerae]
MEATQVDLWAEENLQDPWQAFKELRDAAPAVHLEKYGLWAVGRYADVRTVLKDWRGASSEHGVTACKEHDEVIAKTILDEAPPRHTELIKVFRDKLAPAALRDVTAGIEQRADAIVAECVEKGQFDAVTEIAHRGPVEVVADLIGLPKDERDGLLRRASATFNIFGPDNELYKTQFQADYESLPVYAMEVCTREKLTPGGFGMAVYDAFDQGRLAEDHVLGMILTYLVAAVDTTVNSIGSMMWKLAENPDQWRLLKENPDLARNAYDEALRVETPAFGMTRTAIEDYDVGGVTVPAGSKISPMLRSANRDERRWENPGTFDITRDATGHVAFGHGLHTCIGRPLAYIQGEAVAKALVARVDSMEIAGPVSIAPHNVIRGLSSLPLEVVPARVKAGTVA